MTIEEFPNYTELGLIAEACYPKSKLNSGSSRDIGATWHEVKNHSLHTDGSFSCRLYHHQPSNKYVLAVAGTELFTRSEAGFFESLVSTVGDLWQDLKVMLDKRPSHVDHLVSAAVDILTAKEKALGRPLSSHDVDTALRRPDLAQALTLFSSWLSSSCREMTVLDELGYAHVKESSHLLTHKCQSQIVSYNANMAVLHHSPLTQKIREEVRALVNEPSIKNIKYFVGHSLGGILVKYTVNGLAWHNPSQKFYGLAFNSPDVFASNGYIKAPNARIETVYHPLDPVTAAGRVTLDRLITVLRKMALGKGEKAKFNDSLGVPLEDNNSVPQHPEELMQLCLKAVEKSFLSYKNFICELENNLFAEINTIVQRLSTLHSMSYINDMVMHQQSYKLRPVGQWKEK